MKALTKVRSDISERLIEIRAIESQARGRAQIAAYVDALLADWREQGERRVAADINLCAAGLPADFVSMPVPALLVVALGVDTLRQTLLRHLDTLPDSPPPEARAERLAALRGELAMLEREEERLLRDAHDGGELTAPRADADPAVALLCV